MNRGDFRGDETTISRSEQLISKKLAQKTVFFNFFFELTLFLLADCFFGIGWNSKIRNRTIN